MAESERRVKALNAAQTPKTTYRRMTDDEVAKWFGDIQKQH
jgi:hypothetical protein